MPAAQAGKRLLESAENIDMGHGQRLFVLPAQLPRAPHQRAPRLGEFLVERRGRGRKLPHAVAGVADGGHDHLVGPVVAEGEHDPAPRAKGGVQAFAPRDGHQRRRALGRELGEKQHLDVGPAKFHQRLARKRQPRGRVVRHARDEARGLGHAGEPGVGHAPEQPAEPPGQGMGRAVRQGPDETLEWMPVAPDEGVAKQAHGEFLLEDGGR